MNYFVAYEFPNPDKDGKIEIRREDLKVPFTIKSIEDVWKLEEVLKELYNRYVVDVDNIRLIAFSKII